MKIIITGTQKEVADCVSAIQSQPNMSKKMKYKFISTEETKMKNLSQNFICEQEIAKAEKRCSEIAKSIMSHRV